MDWETSVTPCQGAECQNNNSTEHLFFLFIFEETKFVSEEDVLLLLPIWHLTKLFMIPIRFFDFKCWTLVYEILKKEIWLCRRFHKLFRILSTEFELYIHIIEKLGYILVSWNFCLYTEFSCVWAASKAGFGAHTGGGSVWSGWKPLLVLVLASHL